MVNRDGPGGGAATISDQLVYIYLKQHLHKHFHK